MPTTKIATCCYCGTRAALVLKGRDRHSLACASCGAPLNNLKKIKSHAVDAASHQTPTSRRKGKRRDAPLDDTRDKKVLRKPRKNKKTRLRKAFGDVFDDVFEEVFDLFD